MAQFLRDESLTNLTIDEETLREMVTLFTTRAAAMPERQQPAQGQDPLVLVSQIIRFDNKGYRVFTAADLLSYFQQARDVERIIFTAESTASVRSSKAVGSYMNLQLDEKNPAGCVLVVSSDSGDWVDSSFAAVKDILEKRKNRHGWIRNDWMGLIIQLMGVFLTFFLSLWAAVKMSPHIVIENSFFITFLFVLLVMSNLWPYLNQRLLSFINTVFPNLKFSRPEKDKMHWLLQAIIAGTVVAIVLFFLNATFTYVGRTVGEFFSTDKDSTSQQGEAETPTPQ